MPFPIKLFLTFPHWEFSQVFHQSLNFLCWISAGLFFEIFMVPNRKSLSESTIHLKTQSHTLTLWYLTKANCSDVLMHSQLGKAELHYAEFPSLNFLVNIGYKRDLIIFYNTNWNCMCFVQSNICKYFWVPCRRNFKTIK